MSVSVAPLERRDDQLIPGEQSYSRSSQGISTR